MPRTARAVEAGIAYYVLNRGNGGTRLLHKDADLDALEQPLAKTLHRYPRTSVGDRHVKQGRGGRER